MTLSALLLRRSSSSLIRARISSAGHRLSSSRLSAAAVFSTAPQYEEEEHESESFLTGTSSLYAEAMWESYQEDPNSVHESWRSYFDNLSQGKPFDASLYNSPTTAAPAKGSTRRPAVAGVSTE
jgi:2-oxoglutarate dehydrogenase E1 component